MTPIHIFTECTQAGLSIRLSDTPMEYKLLVSPPALVTPRLRAIIQQHREVIIDALYGATVDELWPPIDRNSLEALMARMAASRAMLNGELRAA